MSDRSDESTGLSALDRYLDPKSYEGVRFDLASGRVKPTDHAEDPLASAIGNLIGVDLEED